MLPSILYLFIIDYLALKCFGFGKMLGPADLIIKSFGYCEPESTDLILKITTKRYNRTISVLDIDIATPFPLDDNIVLELKAYIKKDGGYKPGSFYMKDSYCTVLKTMLGDLFDMILKSVGTDDCPIPEGSYEIRGFFVDNRKFTVPQIYGQYKIEGLLYRAEVLIACFYLYADLEPKDQS